MIGQIGYHLTTRPGEVPECPYCCDPLGSDDDLTTHLLTYCTSVPDDDKEFVFNFAYPGGV